MLRTQHCEKLTISNCRHNLPFFRPEYIHRPGLTVQLRQMPEKGSIQDFQTKASACQAWQNTTFRLSFYFDAHPDPDQAFHFDADPDPAFHFVADPNFQNDENPCIPDPHCVWFRGARGSGAKSHLRKRFVFTAVFRIRDILVPVRIRMRIRILRSGTSD